MKDKSFRYFGMAFSGIFITYKMYHFWLVGIDPPIDHIVFFFSISILASFVVFIKRDYKEYIETKRLKSFNSSYFGLLVILLISLFYYYLKSQNE
jgi:hypothetical protein